MLVSLSIKNYALIDSLHIDFYKGFSIITGETGAGKSILLGGLSLILGKRADLSSLKNKEKKCVIEGEFLITKFDLKSFFDENDIDFQEQTIIRREILPSGKSRAFINDTPTTLSVLSTLSEKLIDIHSQHQTLQLANTNFQFFIIDHLAGNPNYLDSYKRGLVIYKKKTKELQHLIESQQQANEQHDYNSFLANELSEANFKLDEQEFLENTLAKLNHTEEIKLLLAEAKQLVVDDELGISALLHKYTTILSKLAEYSVDQYGELSSRIESVKIEFDDLAGALENTGEMMTYSPQEIEKYNDRLQLLYNLQNKHQTSSIGALLDVQQLLITKVSSVENASEIIEGKKAEIATVEHNLNELAKSIHNNRKKAILSLKEQLKDRLTQLEMPNTLFKINLQATETFFTNGKDELEFLIATNKGVDFKEVKRVASGGEMSRIMLAIKTILSKYSNLPTIIFDEIDTGVSGEVSNRIASVMSAMSKNMQVIAITHLPQIAASGEHHYKVFKTEEHTKTITNVKQLSETERVAELAEMLSGTAISDSAIHHAKQLLNQ